MVHDLPASHDYWIARYILPLLTEVGVASLDELWRREIAAQCRRRAPDPATLVSLGAGNGDLELSLAAALAADGLENLELVLLELNGEMLDRAMDEARRMGIEGRVHPQQADLNSWTASGQADIYLANHSLHHVVELEHLYGEVRRGMTEQGVLLVNDMIGRNGHQRWPEAAACLHRIWEWAPERYRYNHSLGRVDDVYPDLDCSGESFEGIRAQDVLPLLLEHFHPETYITFANVIDPFVDRVYGPNLDPSDADDAAFIDAIARFDDAGLDAHVFTPTHLVATFRRAPVACRYPRDRSPQRTLRVPDEPVAPALASPASAADDGWASYRALRDRKAVRVALRAADTFRRLESRARR